MRQVGHLQELFSLFCAPFFNGNNFCWSAHGLLWISIRTNFSISLLLLLKSARFLVYRIVRISHNCDMPEYDKPSSTRTPSPKYTYCWRYLLNKLYTLFLSRKSWMSNPYPTAFPYGNGMVLHFYQQQESSTTKTVHKVINKGLKTYV